MNLPDGARVVVGCSGGADSLAGGTGNDTLDGEAGIDSMAGGAGNDTYVVDTIGDTVSESAGEGTDQVRSSVTWTLGADLENLVLLGAAGTNGTGNTLANFITGNNAANVLAGVKRNHVERPSVPRRNVPSVNARHRLTSALEAVSHSLVSTMTTRPSASAWTTMSTSCFQLVTLGHWLAASDRSRSQISACAASTWFVSVLDDDPPVANQRWPRATPLWST